MGAAAEQAAKIIPMVKVSARLKWAADNGSNMILTNEECKTVIYMLGVLANKGRG